MQEKTIYDALLHIVGRIHYHRQELARDEAKLEELLRDAGSKPSVTPLSALKPQVAPPPLKLRPVKEHPYFKEPLTAAEAQADALEELAKIGKSRNKALEKEEENAPPFTFADALATARELVAEHKPAKTGRKTMTWKELETVKRNIIAALEAHGPLYATHIRGKVPHSQKTVNRALKALERPRDGRVEQNEDGRWALAPAKPPPKAK